MEWTDKTRSFFADVRGELKRTTFPSKKEVQGTTAVVIATVFVFATYLWVVDTFLFHVIEWIFKTLGT
ncbi:MAG TPA: preprotein translocase subunit SecE [Candidatus Polarisedimenticolia bacterium]|jgi:preprotein translocase subunit SecE|nr:preprotein translocase subunit SecE [Candidatus Polarisedimenticolia bacterium]